MTHLKGLIVGVANIVGVTNKDSIAWGCTKV